MLVSPSSDVFGCSAEESLGLSATSTTSLALKLAHMPPTISPLLSYRSNTFPTSILSVPASVGIRSSAPGRYIMPEGATTCSGPDVGQSFSTGTSGDEFFYYGGSERNRLRLWQCYTNIIKPLHRPLFHPLVFELKPPLPFLGVVKQHILESAKGSLTIYGHLK